MGSFQINSVEVSETDDCLEPFDNAEDDFEPYPEKMSRADYAVREPPGSQDKQEKYMSLTERAQMYLREEQDEEEQQEGE